MSSISSKVWSFVAKVPGHKYVVDEHWGNRLVRCEVKIVGKEIGF